MLENTPNQPSKFRTKSWVEVNDESRGTYNVNSQIKFKNSTLRSSLCDYSDAYVLVSVTITVPNTAAPGSAANNRKNITIKNSSPFTNCISVINNTQIDDAKDIDIVMPMYNLMEYSDNYSKTSGSLWHYCRYEPFLNVNGAIADNNNSASLKFKTKIAGRIEESADTKNVKIRVPLKYLSNFWRTLEMPLINCEINPILTWSNRCFIIDNPTTVQEITFTITDTKIYVPIVTLSTQDNAKLLEQLKSGFKRTIKWNKYEAKVTVDQQNQYLHFLINPSFQGINRFFVSSSTCRNKGL